MIVLDYLARERRFLVIAETGYAVQVYADTIKASLQAAHIPSDQVFHLEHTGMEGVENIVDRLFADEAGTQRKLKERFQEQTEPKPLSLAVYIKGRLRLLRDNSPVVAQDERNVLRSLRTALLRLEDASEDNAAQMQTLLVEQWTEVREYYLRYHAKGVIVTAVTAMARVLRRFHPAHIIFDEGSQLAEHTTVAVLSKFYGTTHKVSIVGDPNQNGVFSASNNEFSRTVQRSLMIRLMETGVPYTFLSVQYRMHPHISSTVSHLFYADRVTDHLSVPNRPENAIWERFLRECVSDCRLRHSIFINVPGSSLYRTKKGRSSVNVSHLLVIREAVHRLLRAEATEKQVAVLTYYREQLRLLKMGLPTGLELSTVNAAQGKDYKFVILDLVTPGSLRYPLRSITDVRKMCVGFSRAEIGLLIVGSEKIYLSQFEDNGIRGWKWLIEEHMRNGALATREPTVEAVDTLLTNLRIPGHLYEAVPMKSEVEGDSSFVTPASAYIDSFV